MELPKVGEVWANKYFYYFITNVKEVKYINEDSSVVDVLGVYFLILGRKEDGFCYLTTFNKLKFKRFS